MIYTIICRDKADGLATRQATRPEHIAYLEGLNEGGTLKFAGPFLDDDGQPIGSMVAVEADNREAAAAIAAADPYAIAGLFDAVEIMPWKWTFNNPEAA